MHFSFWPILTPSHTFIKVLKMVWVNFSSLIQHVSGEDNDDNDDECSQFSLRLLH